MTNPRRPGLAIAVRLDEPVRTEVIRAHLANLELSEAEFMEAFDRVNPMSWR